MNARRMMDKLLMAINLRGRRVKVNQIKKYSEDHIKRVERQAVDFIALE